MSRAHSAFTLIELLIVIAIIGVLMGLLIATIPGVIYNAKALKTASRMDAILHGLSRVGQQEGSAAMILQRDAHLGGVFQFDVSSGALIPAAATIASRSDNAFFPETPAVSPTGSGAPHIFCTPWGKNDLLKPTAASAPLDPNSATGQPKVSMDMLNVDQSYLLPAPAGEQLSSITLMKMSGILPPDDPGTPEDDAVVAYMTDRNAERGWNDAWGNPLVIGWGIYQPAGAVDPAAANSAGKRCRDALSQYQYNRSVYIAIASVGPTPYDVVANAPVDPATYKKDPPDVTEWKDTILKQIWAQACDVCQADRKWDDKGFDNPPWQGVKKGKKRANGYDLKCQLSTPHELK